MTTETKKDLELVTVAIDGVEHQVPKGKNLLQAILDVDIDVPHYCYQPALSIAGNCRLCMIEMEGNPRPMVSCNMTCTDGLRVRTDTELVKDCQRGMMEFLLVNHPLDCPICDRGGECMLQRYSMDYGWGNARTTDERRRFYKPQFDRLIDIERNRCIMCTRCVRFMDEIADSHTLAVVGRGNKNYIGTFGDGPVSSVFSGNIIDICPVGCLTSKPYRFTARPWEQQQVVNTCTLCSAGCATTTWLRDGKVMRVTPPARKYNAGGYTIDEDTTDFICNEGRFGSYFMNSPERLVSAYVRSGDDLEETPAQRALETAAGFLKEAAEAGPDQVAILSGGRQTNEEYYLLSRLARQALGTSQIDWRLDYSTPEAANWAATALAASDGDFDRLADGSYAATLVIGADMFDETPVNALKVKEAARHKLTRLGMIGSRLDGWVSRYADSTATATPEELGQMVSDLAAGFGKKSKLPEDLATVRDMVGDAETGLLIVATDLAGGAFNADVIPAAFELLEKLGEGWKFLPVYRARNAKGAFAAGVQSDRLASGRAALAPSRKAMDEVWGETDTKGAPDYTAADILQRAADGKIKTLLLHRCDELHSHPNHALVQQAIEATEHVIMVDTFPSPLMAHADVVLAGAFPHETEGSMVSVDGTLRLVWQGNQPPGDAQEDWRLLKALLAALDQPVTHESPNDIFRELLSFWKPRRRFNLRDLMLDGPGEESPQRPQPIIRKRTRPDWKLHHSERTGHGEKREAAKAVNNGKGELRLLWHQAIQGADHLARHSSEFDNLRPDPAIELHPQDAIDLGLAAGDIVKISGCVVPGALVRFNDSLPRGLAYGAVNVLGIEIDSTGALPLVTLEKVGSAIDLHLPEAPSETEEV